jgi:hypothetical protein
MASTAAARFEYWSQLPAELKLNVLGHLLTQNEEVYSWVHVPMIDQGDLGNIIAVRNRELVTLALEACTHLFIKFAILISLLTWTSRLQWQHLRPGNNS